jgi:hypothetical protein
MASLKQCESAGHFYDDRKHSSCPYCGVGGIEMPDTRPANSSGGMSATAPAQPDPTDGRTRAAGAPPQDGRTRGFFQDKLGAEPVVGWLVCVDGPHRGRDFRLHSEKNFIGRDPANDICISGDPRISASKHAVVSFDPRNCKYKIRGGDGRGLTYLNGEEVDETTPLEPFNRITLGDTTLLFVPLCGDGFQWPTD